MVLDFVCNWIVCLRRYDDFVRLDGIKILNQFQFVRLHQSTIQLVVNRENPIRLLRFLLLFRVKISYTIRRYPRLCYRSVDYSTIKNFVFNVTKDIRMCDVATLKQKLQQQYDNLNFKPEVALPDLGLNSFTKKYIKNILARVTGFIEESTGVASNYCNYMNTQTKNPFEIEHIITDHYEWFTDEYTDQEDFRRWRNSVGALLLLQKSINASLNDAKYSYKLAKYCSNEGNIYTESLGQLAYQNNPKFKKFISDNGLNFKAYAQFGKAEINERIALLVQLFQLLWNDEMFK